MPQNQEAEPIFWEVTGGSKTTNLGSLRNYKGRQKAERESWNSGQHKILWQASWRRAGLSRERARKKVILHKEAAWRGKINGSLQASRNTWVSWDAFVPAMGQDRIANRPARHSNVKRRGSQDPIRELVFAVPHRGTASGFCQAQQAGVIMLRISVISHRI